MNETYFRNSKRTRKFFAGEEATENVFIPSDSPEELCSHMWLVVIDVNLVNNLKSIIILGKRPRLTLSGLECQ